MKQTTNPWLILGLNPGASEQEIKSAYKKLAHQHHPDKGGTVAHWLAISDAYELLKSKKSVPIIEATNTKLLNITLDISQQILGVDDYIRVDDNDQELFIKVKIPAGAIKGDKFKVSSKGQNYIINIKEKADSVFTRQGNNLIMYKTLDVIDIMKGKPFIIQGPTGEYLEINIPEDTHTGSIIVVKDQGLYNRKTRRKGNLRINVKVNIPHLDKDNMEEFIRRLTND